MNLIRYNFVQITRFEKYRANHFYIHVFCKDFYLELLKIPRRKNQNNNNITNNKDTQNGRFNIFWKIFSTLHFVQDFSLEKNSVESKEYRRKEFP